jgi:hypothetical protein
MTEWSIYRCLIGLTKQRNCQLDQVNLMLNTQPNLANVSRAAGFPC